MLSILCSLVGSLNKIPLSLAGIIIFKVPTSVPNMFSIFFGKLAAVFELRSHSCQYSSFFSSLLFLYVFTVYDYVISGFGVSAHNFVCFPNDFSRTVCWSHVCQGEDVRMNKMAQIMLLKLSSPVLLSNVLMITIATRIDASIYVAINNHNFDIHRVIRSFAHGLRMTLQSSVRSNFYVSMF